MPKIVIIGGGSYTWGPTFLRDILTIPELGGSTIVLEDLDPSRMGLVHQLGQKMLADFQLDYHLEQTSSLDQALDAADFIILTITTGGLESMRPDLEIPARYGIRQSVADTTGPGGLSRARDVSTSGIVSPGAGGCQRIEVRPGGGRERLGSRGGLLPGP